MVYLVRNRLRRLNVWAFVGVVLHLSAVYAGDWPQILGPQRNGIADSEELLTRWPEAGPVVVWSKPVGSGFSGVSTFEGIAFVFHRTDVGTSDREVLEAVDAATGKPLWRAHWPASYQDSIAGDNGPRCVPVVSGKQVFAYGAAGDLACVNIKDGKVNWSKNLITEYGADLGYFGAGSTPLVEGKTLIVNVGGRATGAGVVGLSTDTGKELWKSVSDTASYSSPIATTIDGTRLVLCITRLNLVALDPETGKTRFSIPFGQRGPTVNGATPTLLNNHVLVTASYGIGSVFAKITSKAFEIQWANGELLSSQYTTGVVREGLLYAVDGRQDQGEARLRCLDVMKQKILWSEEDFGMATLILANDILVCMKTDGTLVLVQANPGSFQKLASTQLFNRTCRALPALSNGRLYVRDTETLKCVKLGKN